MHQISTVVRLKQMDRGGTSSPRCIESPIDMHVGNDTLDVGLGTGIVEALVKNLDGEITLSDAGPGTIVTIDHQESAGLRADLSPSVYAR